LTGNMPCRHMGTVNCKVRAALAQLKRDEGTVADAPPSLAVNQHGDDAQPTNQASDACKSLDIPILPGVPFKEREAIRKWPTSDIRKIWNEEMDFPAEWTEIIDALEGGEKVPTTAVVK
jgi:hypothetical protein